MAKGTKIISFETLQIRALEKQKKDLRISLIEKGIEVIADDLDRRIMDLHILMEEGEE